MTGRLTLEKSRSVVEYGFNIEKKGASPSWVKQVHGTGIRHVGRDDKPVGAIVGDAVITSQSGTEIYVYTADCLPVLLAGSDLAGNTTIAAIHSGWRGTMKGIVPEVLKDWTVPLKDTYAIIGPAIGACHFEVKQDFVEEFKRHAPAMQNYLDQRDGGMFFRLADFLRCEQLRGLPDEHILTQFQHCTVCSTPKLPSYRRNKGTDPQIRGWIRFSKID